MDFPLSVLESFELNRDALPAEGSDNEKMRVIRELLIQRIDELLHNDVEKLKWILYRIDVNEKKLHQALQNSEADAATVMADMIIARQIEKAESRKKFGGNENDWIFDV